MATPVIAFAQLANECEAEGMSPNNAEKIAAEIAKTFSVQLDEVAIIRMVKSNLAFVYPTKLSNMGSIPINTSTSVAARTANTKRAEAINNFAQAKHASVFEAMVSPTKKAESAKDLASHVIQKLMTVPVVSAAGVLGVIQVCRKGKSAPESGADFGPPDLQRLVQIATSLVKCFK
jgi:transcriptional regulator with GAF, ATPase, and Fis domain